MVLQIYLCATLLAEFASLVQSIAIGWRVYELSGSAFILGIVGLVQFLPMFLLTLPSGELCDRLGPRRILTSGLLLQGASSAVLFALVLTHFSGLWLYFVPIVLAGAARGIYESAALSLLPFLVPAERLPAAISRGSSLREFAVIAGPAAGGLLYAWNPSLVYSICSVASVAAALGIVALRDRPTEPVPATLHKRLERVMEGIRFVRSQPIVLGAVSLDLCAVLLGGATTLLPVYARDILRVGPIGLGLLRSAPAAGAFLTALWLAHQPIRRQMGFKLLCAVGVFGAATIVFGLSTWLPISVAALAVAGASDMISVTIRSVLIQLATPDAMRGRVSSVNMLFIGASSELGGFESGIAAALLGTVPAVVFGGIGAVAAVPVWAQLFPRLVSADDSPAKESFPQIEACRQSS